MVGSRPLLVIVTGPPAAGKSTLARSIATGLRLPLLEMDAIKEALFEHLGASTREESDRLGAVSLAAMLRVAQEVLGTGGAAVIEAPLDPELAGPVAALIEAAGCVAVQVVATAPPEVRLERHRGRLDAPDRHPAHRLTDSAEVAAWTEQGVPGYEPLGLPCPALEVDTADPGADRRDLIDALQALLEDAG